VTNLRDAHDTLDHAVRYVMRSRNLVPFPVDPPPLDVAQAVAILSSLRDLLCALICVYISPKKVN
jgi:hypothetical protein